MYCALGPLGLANQCFSESCTQEFVEIPTTSRKIVKLRGSRNKLDTDNTQLSVQGYAISMKRMLLSLGWFFYLNCAFRMSQHLH